MKAEIALLAGGLAVAVGGAEVALRRTLPLWAILDPPVCFRPDLFQPVEAYGYRLWPSRTIEHVYPPQAPRRLTLTTNADGFRGRNLHQPDPRPRLVIAGDSMVFGEGVQEEERFTNVLEAIEPRWRVENLGMIGYGPDLMLRALEAVGLDPAPDVVVFAIFTDDFRRLAPHYAGAGFPLPRFDLEDGRLVTVPYPGLRLWERVRVVQGLLYLRWRYTGAAFPLTAAILDRLRALGRERGFAPALAFLPGQRDGWEDRRRRAWLAAYAARTGTPFLDLTETLATGRTTAFHIAGDSHWNAAGHRVVAEALRPFVARACSLGGRPPATARGHPKRRDPDARRKHPQSSLPGESALAGVEGQEGGGAEDNGSRDVQDVEVPSAAGAFAPCSAGV